MRPSLVLQNCLKVFAAFGVFYISTVLIGEAILGSKAKATNGDRSSSPDNSSTISFEYFLKVLESRIQRVTDFCDDDSQSRVAASYRSAFGHLTFMPAEDILWCPVFKAGTTTWRHNLLDLSHLTEEEKASVRKEYEKDAINLLQPLTKKILSQSYEKLATEKTKSFMIVRHPFTRLVSAFRDKLEQYHKGADGDYTKDFYYEKFGKLMVGKHRNASLEKFGEDFFSEANNFGTPVMPATGMRTKGMPTFWEFAQYLKETVTPMMDQHWMPMSAYCAPCKINYKYIVKFEELGEEGRHLGRILNPEAVLDHDKKYHVIGGDEQDELTAKYFSMLDPEDVTDLYKIYADDFDMFGYERRV